MPASRSSQHFDQSTHVHHPKGDDHMLTSVVKVDVNPSNSIETKPVRQLGRKASITREELFQATLKLIGSEKSISSLSLREVAREAGIAPNSFYRHFKDVDELAIALIERAGQVLRKIIREARTHASRKVSVIRSSVEIFLQQLDADDGNLSLLLRESYTGSRSYQAAVEQELSYFQQELHEDLIKIGLLRRKPLHRPDVVAKAITQLVFHMGAKVLDLPAEQRQRSAEDTMLMIRMIMEGARHVDDQPER